jgi:hypothetical protein
MKTIFSRFVISGLLAFVGACGGTANGELDQSKSAVSEANAANAEKPRADEHGNRDCPDRAEFDGVSSRIEAQLNIARRAVCRYRRLEAALADGYTNTGLPCIPGQGYHYINNTLVGTTDIRRPSVLMYTADGRLNGPEWVAPESEFPTPPSIFGQTMHSEDELGLWIVHVWVWKLNPNGVFNDANPEVTCP